MLGFDLANAASAYGGARLADGSLVRYHLSVQPWLALLDHHISSRTWQEQSMQAIIDTVLGAYPQAAWA